MILYARAGQAEQDKIGAPLTWGLCRTQLRVFRLCFSFPDLESLCRPLRKHTEEIRLLLRNKGIRSFTCRSGSY